MRADWFSFLVAFAVSVILTFPVRHLALRLGIVDRPGTRKIHSKPMPLLGGVAIYLGLIAAVLRAFHSAMSREVVAVVAGATLLLLVGILDERGFLHHQIKLFIGMPIAAVFLLLSGIRAHVFSEFFGGTFGVFLDICLTLFWSVGITAAFSILDHMDGLCAGIVMIASAFFAFSANDSGQTIVWALASCVMGAALGFLFWNFNPARIFMGDGGAMMLGFLMATLGLMLHPANAEFPIAQIVPILILGVPVFDTTLISISRSRRGLIPFTSPGKDHSAHRLTNLGLKQRGAVLSLYAVAVAFGAAGLALPQLTGNTAYALLGSLILAGAIAIAFLESVPFERQVKVPRREAA